ncbi:glucose PTS transporter subunit IIA [Dielma fastidiosa]|uniref:glucose PTS transporter subunit IIA n=1 Tax=Dielma fastidiosa TaxID=1034346 RepID=UPI0035678C29
MNRKEIVESIIEALGGKENIKNYTHCVTRLRFNLADDAKADLKKIDGIDKILGTTIQGGQYQIIIGTSVNKYYDEVTNQLAGIVAFEDKKIGKNKFSPMRLLDVLTSIIAPVIPAFCAAGMLKCICLLLITLGIMTGEEGAYIILDFTSDVAFYFLPILIAMSSAKRFKVDQGLSICVAGALLYPSFVSLVNDGGSLSFFGLQVPMYSYSSTIFPALLGVLLLSYVYRFWNQVIRFEAIKLLLVPLLSLLITIPLTLLFIAPLGNWGSILLSDLFTWLIHVLGPFAGLIIGFLLPIMTLTGLHQSLAPIELMELTGVGFSIILPLEFFHNLAEAGAALGTAVATKDTKLKAIASSTGFTAFIGISEPALYSVMVKNKYAMLSAMIANGVGGFFSILFSVKCFAYVWPNIFSLPSFMENGVSSLLTLVMCALITFIIGFILPITFAKLGFNEKATIAIHAPIKGDIIPLSEVNDEVFSKKMCGDGLAIKPKDNCIYAPCDGKVVVAMKHAVGIQLKNGCEILIHVGLNTSDINDHRMLCKVAQGDVIKKGQLLITFQLQELEKQGYDMTCIIVNTKGEIINTVKKQEVMGSDSLFQCLLNNSNIS